MSYTIQEVQENLSLNTTEIEDFLKDHQLKVEKSGRISKKSYQVLADSSLNLKSSDHNESIYILNGHKIPVKSKPFYESKNQRVSIFQDDAINFLKGLPSNS
ncbi:MAG: hypothetical protein EOP45_22665, partial [Sphingobacteriaceae bacterium]